MSKYLPHGKRFIFVYVPTADDYIFSMCFIIIYKARIINGQGVNRVITRSPNVGTWNSNEENFEMFFNESSNRAVLGVVTEADEAGAKIKAVSKESAAEKAGLKEDDILVQIDDKKITNPDDLATTIRSYKPDDKINITYQRGKKVEKTTAVLSKMKSMQMMGTIPGKQLNFEMNDLDLRLAPGIQSIPRSLQGFGQNWSWNSNAPKLGLSVQDTDDGKGVKVIEVTDESNAAKAGFKKDDVITEIDGKTVNGTDDMVKIMKESKEKNIIMAKLLRNGKSQNLEVKIPKKIKTVNL